MLDDRFELLTDALLDNDDMRLELWVEEDETDVFELEDITDKDELVFNDPLEDVCTLDVALEITALDVTLPATEVADELGPPPPLLFPAPQACKTRIKLGANTSCPNLNFRMFMIAPLEKWPFQFI